MQEEWKPLKDLNLLVSNNGKVKVNDFFKRQLTPHCDKDLYMYVNYKYKKYYIHRLVAMAFLENIDNKKHVHHKNFIKYDNNSYNLEWVTHEENMAYNRNNDKTKKISISMQDELITLLETHTRKEVSLMLGVSTKTLYCYLKSINQTRKQKLMQYLKEEIAKNS